MWEKRYGHKVFKSDDDASLWYDEDYNYLFYNNRISNVFTLYKVGYDKIIGSHKTLNGICELAISHERKTKLNRIKEVICSKKENK